MQPANRLSTARSKFKQACSSFVKSDYSLGGPDTPERVRELKLAMRYIYPGDVLKVCAK